MGGGEYNKSIIDHYVAALLALVESAVPPSWGPSHYAVAAWAKLVGFGVVGYAPHAPVVFCVVIAVCAVFPSCLEAFVLLAGALLIVYSGFFPHQL